MKRIICFIIIFTIAVAALAACSSIDVSEERERQEQKSQDSNQDNNQNNDQGNSQDSKSEQEPSNWPLTIDETIVVEGMEEPVTLNLFNKGVNFVTYVPEHLLAESASSGEGDAYWFFTNYGGNKRDDAFVKIYFFPEEVKDKPDLSEEKERLSLQHLDIKPINDADKFYEWALSEYSSSYDSTYTAHALLGQHEGRYFSIVIHFPWEFGDGLAPRVNKILEHFYWTDTNEYLIKR